MTRAKTSVLVIDDSAVVRRVISEILAAKGGMRVLAAVADPLFAMERMRIEWPQVIVLDVEMPRMDGITFLRKIMAERPTPVVICSTLSTQGARTTMEAFAAGAVAVVPKPRVGVKEHLLEISSDLVHAVKAAAVARVAALAPRPPPAQACGTDIAGEIATAMVETSQSVVAIGTSTGGTQALEAVLPALPRDAAGLVIVQHMPEKFTAAFAQRLDDISAIEVREAKDGDRVVRGLALIAPGGRHMQLARSGAQYFVRVTDGPSVNRHRPSVDVLFRSVAQHAGRNALGVIMTGMGDDGARGLKAMFDAGAATLAQDEESCVVFGMPKEAIRLGAAGTIAPLDRIARMIACPAGWHAPSPMA